MNFRFYKKMCFLVFGICTVLFLSTVHANHALKTTTIKEKLSSKKVRLTVVPKVDKNRLLFDIQGKVGQCKFSVTGIPAHKDQYQPKTKSIVVTDKKTQESILVSYIDYEHPLVCPCKQNICIEIEQYHSSIAEGYSDLQNPKKNSFKQTEIIVYDLNLVRQDTSNNYPSYDVLKSYPSIGIFNFLKQ